MIHPECEHDCTSNCRREGCECLCGEYHDSYEPEEDMEIPGFEGTLEALDNLKIR